MMQYFFGFEDQGSRLISPDTSDDAGGLRCAPDTLPPRNQLLSESVDVDFHLGVSELRGP